ncbi:MAG TPA: hypothetical protein VIH59_23205, partial [Candidatus Tectomicrobia bacterium]
GPPLVRHTTGGGAFFAVLTMQGMQFFRWLCLLETPVRSGLTAFGSGVIGIWGKGCRHGHGRSDPTSPHHCQYY